MHESKTPLSYHSVERETRRARVRNKDIPVLLKALNRRAKSRFRLEKPDFCGIAEDIGSVEQLLQLSPNDWIKKDIALLEEKTQVPQNPIVEQFLTEERRSLNDRLHIQQY